jgi:hypothetical protein
MEAFVRGVSVWGPGLQGWAASRPILAGLHNYIACEASPPIPTLLSATERRRTGPAARLAMTVAQQASEMAGIVPGAIPSMFATANGDGAVVHSILEALTAEQPVSPTMFHNSVHNTAAGYWSIATGSQQATNCVACHNSTAAAALLKAMAEVQTECRPLLLCVYDVPLPGPLDACHSTCGSFGAGMVLGPEGGDCDMGRLSVRYDGTMSPSDSEMPRHAALRDLARNNPAARTLRLLESLALGVADEFSMALLDGRVEVRVQPCSPASASSN